MKKKQLLLIALGTCLHQIVRICATSLLRHLTKNRLFIPFCARFVYKFSQGRARAHSLKLDNFRSDSIQSKLGKTSFSY